MQHAIVPAIDRLSFLREAMDRLFSESKNGVYLTFNF